MSGGPHYSDDYGRRGPEDRGFDDYGQDRFRRPVADVPNYLAQAILCTLFCCLPAGVVAIVFAAQVNGKLTAGDYAGAEAASAQARTWCWVSFGVGLAGGLIYALIMLAAGRPGHGF
jgi:hypothetical protein